MPTMSKASDSPGELKDDQWLRDFRRALGYVWPQKKRLVWCVLFIALGAASYSAGLGLILPVLKVMVDEEGLHGWANRLVAEERTGLGFDVYDSRRFRKIPGAPEFSLLVRDVAEDRATAETGIRGGDLILGVDGEPLRARALLRRIAQADANAAVVLDVGTERDGELVQSGVTVTLAPVPLKLRLLQAGVGVLPIATESADRLRTLLVLLALLFVVQILTNGFRFGADYLTAVISYRAILDLRRRMSRQVMVLPVGHYARNVSDTVSRFVQDPQELHKGFTTVFEKMIREPLKAIAVLCMAFLLDWRLTLVLVVVAPIAAFLIRRFGKKIRKASLKVLRGYGTMLGALNGALTGIRAVKGFSMENYERKRLFRIDRGMFRQQLRMARVDAMSKPVMEMLGFVVVSVCIVWLAGRVIGGDLKPADFATTLILLAAMLDPLRKLSNMYVRLQRANAAAHRIFALIDTPGEELARPGAPALPAIQRSIEFREVTFRYAGTDAPVLCDVNLSVKQGEVIALVGPNGSGKTTLISLLLRFFEPDSGRILIDDQDVSEVTLRSLRGQISLISQETVIFGDTVRANIGYGKSRAGDEQIVAAAKKAFAHEFISQLPQGYETLIGEHGATLSGGQRQRLAIARAILRDAPILVFDEATSQVDSESELKIHQALEAFLTDRTAFIIAHRFSTIATADRIAVMDAGRIVAVGTHKVLLDSCDLYRRLYETQFRNAG